MSLLFPHCIPFIVQAKHKSKSRCISVFYSYGFRLLFASRLASDLSRAASSHSRDSDGSGSGTESDTNSNSDAGSSQSDRVEAAETGAAFDITDWHCEQQLRLVRSATLHDRAPLALGLLNTLHAVCSPFDMWRYFILLLVVWHTVLSTVCCLLYSCIVHSDSNARALRATGFRGSSNTRACGTGGRRAIRPARRTNCSAISCRPPRVSTANCGTAPTRPTASTSPLFELLEYTIPLDTVDSYNLFYFSQFTVPFQLILLTYYAYNCNRAIVLLFMFIGADRSDASVAAGSRAFERSRVSISILAARHERVAASGRIGVSVFTEYVE